MSKAYLTIDDAPTKITPKIMDYLCSKGIVPVINFIGENVDQYFNEAIYAVKKGAKITLKTQLFHYKVTTKLIVGLLIIIAINSMVCNKKEESTESGALFTMEDINKIYLYHSNDVKELDLTADTTNSLVNEMIDLIENPSPYMDTVDGSVIRGEAGTPLGEGDDQYYAEFFFESEQTIQFSEDYTYTGIYALLYCADETIFYLSNDPGVTETGKFDIGICYVDETSDLLQTISSLMNVNEE